MLWKLPPNHRNQFCSTFLFFQFIISHVILCYHYTHALVLKSMHRRGAGIAAIKNKHLAQARYKDKGSEIASDQLLQLSKQLDAFRTNLEQFARKHKGDIRRDADFRTQFQQMCATIGVDPLASSKGFWAELLGVGDFYYELGVQIIEVCMATNHRNGGLMYIDELRDRVIASRSCKGQDININDLLVATKKLRSLGNGFCVIPVGRGHLVQSVPGELNMDHTTILNEAQVGGFITLSGLVDKLRWQEERAQHALDFLVTAGHSWVDDQSRPHRQYWFPGLFHASGSKPAL